jgi:hypothetical protein
MRLREPGDGGRSDPRARERERPARRGRREEIGSREARGGGRGSGPVALIAGLIGAAIAILREAVAIVLEMLRIPAGLYMWVAERAGALVLAGWRVLVPVVLALWGLGRSAIRLGARTFTPLRATLLAATGVAALLAASQFVDYTATQISTDAYAEVDSIAPPPEVDSERTGAAHAWLGVPIAALALVGVAACATRRRWGALLIGALGLATVALSLLVDMPKGLEEGDAAIAYEGARATLQGGFWAQLAAGALLVALAPLAAIYGGPTGRRPQRERARRAARARRARPASPVAEG